MVGILIISHDELGNSLAQCATHIFGEEPPLLINQGISIHDDPGAIIIKSKSLIEELDQGDGVLIMTDIIGATPCNIARQLTQSGRVECLAGMNLPMLIRAISYRHEPLSTMLEKALTGARDGIARILPEY